MDNGKVELKGLDKVLAILHPDVYKKAMATTLNRVGTHLKKITVEEVRQTYNVKNGSLKEKLEEQKANTGRLVWSMEVPKTKKLNLMSYMGTRKVSGGLSISVIKGKRTILKHAFIGNKGKTVFERIPDTQMKDKTTKYSHYKNGNRKKREKIRAMVGLSPSQMISEKLKDKKLEEAEKKIPDEFKHQFNFYIGNIKK